MAGNFWASSHYQQWLVDRQDLYRERAHDLKVLSEEDYQKIMMLFSNVIQTLGEQLKFRQQVIATATIYFKRFYARNSLKCIDPWLMAPTCAFLASKVEEYGVISNSRLITTCQNIVKNKFGHAFNGEYPYRIQHVFEAEFYLLEMMDCCLIMYHPYRPLTKFCADLNAEADLLPIAWRMVNDCLRTDAPLLYPPYLIALCSIPAAGDLGADNLVLTVVLRAECSGAVANYSCLHLASIVKQKDIKTWCAELAVDMDKVMEITRMMVNLYDLWKTYDEKKDIQAILARMPKPSPSRPPSEAPNLQDSQQQQQQQQQLLSSVP